MSRFLTLITILFLVIYLAIFIKPFTHVLVWA